MPATQDDPFLSQDKSSHPGDYRDRSLSLLLRLLVVMIVACFIYTIIRAVERSFPGWEGLYLVGFCAFVGLEAIWMRRITAQIEFPDKAWIAIHVSEFVILLLLLKVVTYLVDGSQRFAQDVDAWKTNFVSSFFSGELIVAGGLGLLAWGLHMLFFKFLDELEVSELDQLRDGLASVERSKARAAILNNYLALGGVMVIITTLQQLATRYHWWNQAVQLGWDIISVLIYFILGLVLQAMIQYLHVRDRWMVEGGIVPDRIKARWMGYTLGLVLAVGIIAYLLPTRYSLGGLASLKMLFGVLFNFLGTLLVVFIYPLAYIWQLLLKALSANPPTQ